MCVAVLGAVFVRPTRPNLQEGLNQMTTTLLWCVPLKRSTFALTPPRAAIQCKPNAHMHTYSTCTHPLTSARWSSTHSARAAAALMSASTAGGVVVAAVSFASGTGCTSGTAASSKQKQQTHTRLHSTAAGLRSAAAVAQGTATQ